MAVALVVAVLASLTQLSQSVAPSALAQTAPAKPNILTIMLDDARFDVWRMLPKTADILFKTGVNYVNTTTPNPNCCPARAAFMSGIYPHNNGVRTQSEALKLDQERTVESYLTKAGYRTAMAGKYLISWPDKVAPPNFDRYTYIKGGYYNYYPLVGVKGQPGTTLFKQTDEASYSTNFLTAQLQKDIDTFVSSDPTKPWYGHLAYQAPHIDQPLYQDRATPEAKYANTPVPPCAAQGEADKNDKPLWIKYWNVPLDDITRTCTSEERTLLSVDDNVSSLLNHLRDTNQLANTLVVLTSDNGHMWNENNLTHKFTPYAPSVRIPLTMAWPGHLPAGATDTRRISLVDVLPTILQAAAIQPDTLGKPIDGHSILTNYSRRFHYNEYWYDSQNSVDLPSWAEIRMNVTKPPYNGQVLAFHRWYTKDPTKIGPVSAEEVYNISTDYGQEINLLGDNNPSNDPPLDVMNELRATLEAAHTCSGSTCP